MAKWKHGMLVSGAALALLALASCGNGGSAVETRDRTTGETGATVEPAGGASGPAQAASEKATPLLTSNRRETIDAKTARLFERNGADFGAATAAEYLDKVQRFTGRPPAGTERIERPNGDVLLYQASSNTFAVVSREGVAKTMFKPRDGAAYWAEQKAAAPTFGAGRARSSNDAE